MSVSFTPETFEPHVGTDFSFELDDGTEVTTVLASVLRHPTRPDGERIEPFSLIFEGAPGPALAQATYCGAHAHLGSLSIFIVPIGPDAAGRQRYEAVFN